MCDYKVKLKLISPLITPLDADTIFGHICWAFKFLKGEEFLEKFLDEFEKQPKFLVSDGFISGTLPKPILPDLKDKEIKSLVFEMLGKNKYESGGEHESEKEVFIKRLAKIKEIKNRKTIPFDLFMKLRSNFSEKDFVEELLNNDYKDIQNFAITEIIHNTIDRLASSITDNNGNIYTQNETFYYKNTCFDVYLKIFDKDCIELLKNAFNFISEDGYGKDKSIGKGYFKIEEEIKKFDEFDNMNSNYVMSLSSFILNEQITESFYDLKTKYGKVYMKVSETSSGNFNPFKKPLIMFVAGSILKPSKNIENPENLLGTLINNINSDPKIRQYAYCYPVKINIK